MVEYIECYPEYKKFEGFLKTLIRILNLSFVPWTVLKGYAKFFLVVLEVYALTSTVSTLITFAYFEENLMAFLLRVMMVIGITQLLIKTVSIIMKPNEMENLFLFIEEAHQFHEVNLITDSPKIYLKHLKRNLDIIKIILR